MGDCRGRSFVSGFASADRGTLPPVALVLNILLAALLAAIVYFVVALFAPWPIPTLVALIVFAYLLMNPDPLKDFASRPRR